MPSQVYSEQAEDVFDPVNNPGDWLEVIDLSGGNSPSSASFSKGAQNAKLVGYIPWNKQRSAIEWFLGYSWCDSSYILHRQNPEAHPTFPQLYAAQVDLVPFNPQATADDDDDYTLMFASPFYDGNLVSLNVAQHRMAICTVTFRSFQNAFMDDADITDPRLEWMRNTVPGLDPSVECLSAEGTSQLGFAETGAGGPALKQAFPAPISEILSRADYSIDWLDVPIDFLSTEDDYFWPQNIMDCLGRVNSDDFPYGSSDPFVAGTLRFDSVKFRQQNFPVTPATPSVPLKSVDVSLRFKYADPPKGVPGSSYYGHLIYPFRATGLFYYATRDGTLTGAPMLQPAVFENIFVSPNA